VFAGDDRTDLDAIDALTAERANGLATLAIAVRHADTPQEILQKADLVVTEVSGMVQQLHEIVAHL
jgi:hypothetical protein